MVFIYVNDSDLGLTVFPLLRRKVEFFWSRMGIRRFEWWISICHQVHHDIQHFRLVEVQGEGGNARSYLHFVSLSRTKRHARHGGSVPALVLASPRYTP